MCDCNEKSIYETTTDGIMLRCKECGEGNGIITWENLIKRITELEKTKAVK